jgi:type II secretion system protein I
MNRRPHITHRRASGFTLIEVLAAIGVLIIVLPTIMSAFSLAGDLAGLTRQRAQATAVAHSVMDEQLATNVWLNGTSSGDEQVGSTTYHWETILDNYPDADNQNVLNVEQLEVRVTWNRRGSEREIVLSTLVYNNPNLTQTSTSMIGGTP